MPADDAPKRNHILAALPAAVYARLRSRLQPVTLTVGRTLIPAHGNPRHVYFPTTSVVCLSYGVAHGPMAKAWLVGNEGMIGISAFLGGTAASNQAEVEIAGEAFRLDALALRDEFRRGEDLQRLLLRYVEALITQASQLGVCGHSHSIDQRLCRFLLRTFDRMPDNILLITQQRIGRLLGVRRESITEAASRLQTAGIISYGRGRIVLQNRRQLQARTCSCYSVIVRAFDSLRRTAGRN